jgi:hypothetical protein
MSKLMQVYGISIDEALRLSEAQVSVMQEHLDAAATELLKNDTEFQKTISEKLAPMRRAVRVELSGGWEFEAPPESGEEDADGQGGYVAEGEEADTAEGEAPLPSKPSRPPRPAGKPIGKPPKT